ncbi:MAG TPA: methyltransferase type 12 [Gammaproteobacteria bacterium]|nr:methyltransferase type 12 [Gammaproteobacteria bacterium]
MHRINTPLLWHISLDEMKYLYTTHISSNHLDVGVGSGLLLDSVEFPSSNPRVALLDLNSNSLNFTANRIARYQPELYRANALSRRDIKQCSIPRNFDSIACNYLIHCLPGHMHQKAVLFDNMIQLLNPNGVLFGATIVKDGVDQYVLSRVVNSIFNSLKIFSNYQDTTNTLLEVLSTRFQKVHVELLGCVALYSASKLKTI